ncbi:MAG TPA: putative manganese-dependent inorganic diphosphatase, partial [Lachnoclostridium sp.]|nr:putative manganese-dependent inorganic diphosphatase [Lachnoclostridium sp.]
MESAEILEIIDHHRLGTVETIAPVFFRNQPVGCTATIVYQMYQENNVEVEPKIAGLLCSAIISDTLLFRSPTCTESDRLAALALADIAGIQVDKYASSMFAAGSNLKGKTDGEIFYQDFKKFTVGKVSFGVGQISSLNAKELEELKDRMVPYMKKAREEHGVDMMFFMLTNILTESTVLLCEGQGAKQMVARAFRAEEEETTAEDHTVSLPGVVSRKKQLIPGIMLAVQE